MPTLSVNGKEVEFEPGMTVLQACELAGEEIPRFCYHERLKIAGNCRMCLVQIEGGPPKPAASCAMPAGDGMKVHTNTEMVKKAREGVMEFLLINHPLDCPICDQGGECDLQDQAMAYGRGTSRFDEHKRTVKEKHMGPLIKTHMTRCIQCTRCVRFMDDVAGVPVLGAVNRGEDMEITTYLHQGINSELSGNIIDLCPVGALTSKPYAFKARSWELRKTSSIDVMDAVGSNIRIDARGNEVMRILPRLNEAVNEEWISDKTRFSYDGLNAQRIDRPYLRQKGKLVPATWDDAMDALMKRLGKSEGKNIAAIAGDVADCESIFLLKILLEALGSPHMDCRQDGAKLETESRGQYLFNSTIAGIDEADACLLIGVNPRHDAPIINARLRKRSLNGDFPIALLGPQIDLTYDYEHLGDSIASFEQLAANKLDFAKRFKKAKKPMLIIGQEVLTRSDAAAIMGLISEFSAKAKLVTKDWNGINILHKAASRVGALDLEFVPQNKGKDVSGILRASATQKLDLLFLLGADEIDTEKCGTRNKASFTVYIGSHGDKGASCADIVLPATAYTEKDATYVNTEGRVQYTHLAALPPGQAKEDWRIIAGILYRLDAKHMVTNIEDVRDAMAARFPVFANTETIEPGTWKAYASSGKLTKQPFTFYDTPFYMTDPISRHSKNMANCVAEFNAPKDVKSKKKAA